MKKPVQLSFGDSEHLGKKKTTRRERFLSQLDQLLPWPGMLALIEPHYPSSGRVGRQPLGLDVMLRVHIAQIAYNYSDPGMEEALYEIASLRHFCGISINHVPDESTILSFRRLLERHELSRQLFEGINATLAERGLFLRQGTIVDASLIAAPSSTKNETNGRDPDMHQSRKGEQWYFGGKLHVGVDMRTGLTHSLSFTAGNVADVVQAHEVLCGSETSFLGDAGYQGIGQREENRDSSIKTWAVAQRPGRLKKLIAIGGDELGQQLRAISRELASRRAKVEHVFHRIKLQFGYAKVRYRGLAKNTNRFYLLAALGNVLSAASYERRHAVGAS